MSQLLQAKSKLPGGKPALVLLAAFVANFLIFYLILQMVSNKHEPLNRIESVNFLDFINLDQTPEIEERKVEKKQQEPPEQEEKPQAPDLPKPEIKKPQKTQADLPRPDINIPLSVKGLPYIGDFLKSEKPISRAVPEKPRIADNLMPTLKTKPSYPARALRSGLEGVVTVEFTIATDGSVKDPVIIKSSPPEIFDRSVLKAIQRWKFSPEIINGKAVEKRARQDVHFKLDK